MKTAIVLGLFFGDECKGLVTSSLANENDLVVRFSGGHQAGHTVEHNNYRHIFSNFGSGTLKGAHTYWSQYCTFCPKAFYNEGKKLIEEGYKPVHYIHPMAMVTTPFDRMHNQKIEAIQQHGSVGVGFGATIWRNEKTPHKLYAVDLMYRPLLRHKLDNIAQFYGVKGAEAQAMIEEFIGFVDKTELVIRTLAEIKDEYTNIVFEGSQGIMLDMDFGFFPNVTRSNTTSKNAMQIIKDNGLPLPEIYYCMRSYLTRHGNGYMPNESTNAKFPDETNVSHKFQGEFRHGYHDINLLLYALSCDNTFSSECKKNIVITCLNQTYYNVYLGFDEIPVKEFIGMIGYNTFVSNNSTSEIRHSDSFIDHMEINLDIARSNSYMR